MAKKKKTERRDASRLFVPAGTLIGLGIGFLIDKVTAGVLIGIGVGFLVMALVRLARKK